MSVNTTQQKLLKSLPGVDQMLLAAEGDAAVADAPHRLVLKSIRDLLAEYREAILEQKLASVELSESLEEGLLIEAPRLALERVLDNLLNNATKALPPDGGTLRLCVRRDYGLYWSRRTRRMTLFDAVRGRASTTTTSTTWPDAAHAVAGLRRRSTNRAGLRA